MGVHVPNNIREELIKVQYQRIGALIPVLYFTIAIIAIVAASASEGGFDLVYHVLLPCFFIGMGAYRCLVWVRRKSLPFDYAKARRHLISTTILAYVLGLIGGLWTLDAYYDTVQVRRVLAPIFIFMLTFAGAICLNSLPRAAIGAMVTALVPSSIAMIISTDAGIQAMGISLLIVSFLMVGLVLTNFAQIVSGLKLRFELKALAESDALTELSNRRAFTSRFSEMIDQGQGKNIVLTMIDLDGFKQANDRFGHAAGDAVLIEVAKRLKSLCAHASCIARLGGDEFAVLSTSNGNFEHYDDQKEAIRTVLALPYIWEEYQIMISASLGVASYPDDGRSLSDLMKHSDSELYMEKFRTNQADSNG